MFEFRPELVDDDDAEADDTKYASDEDENDEEEVMMRLSTLSATVSQYEGVILGTL